MCPPSRGGTAPTYVRDSKTPMIANVLVCPPAGKIMVRGAHQLYFRLICSARDTRKLRAVASSCVIWARPQSPSLPNGGLKGSISNAASSDCRRSARSSSAELSRVPRWGHTPSTDLLLIRPSPPRLFTHQTPPPCPACRLRIVSSFSVNPRAGPLLALMEQSLCSGQGHSHMRGTAPVVTCLLQPPPFGWRDAASDRRARFSHNVGEPIEPQRHHAGFMPALLTSPQRPGLGIEIDRAALTIYKAGLPC